MLTAFWGSNMAAFAVQQKNRVERLAQKLYEGLIAGDGGAYLARTGSLLRSTTLRTRETREAFHIILQACTDEEISHANDKQKQRDKRFWSKRCVENALRKMMKDHSLELPIIPGFRWPDWFKEQTEILQSLAKRATRNQRSKPMDELETLPFDAQDSHFRGYQYHLFATYISTKGLDYVITIPKRNMSKSSDSQQYRF